MKLCALGVLIVCVALSLAEECTVDYHDITTRFVDNFDVESFEGVWYEMDWEGSDILIDKYHLDFVDHLQYYPSTNNTVNSTYSVMRAGRPQGSEFDAECNRWTETWTIDPDNNAHFTTHFDESTPIDLYVVATDYADYAVLWGCWKWQDGQCTDREVKLSSRYILGASSAGVTAQDAMLPDLCINYAEFLGTHRNNTNSCVLE